MSGLSKRDEMLVARFVDGELPAAERAAFERRLRDDGALRDAVQDARELSRRVRSAAPRPQIAPVGFGVAVLEQVRRLPPRDELVRQEADEAAMTSAVAFAQRLLIAAVVLFGLGLLLGLDLLRDPDRRELEADALTKVMRELDQKVIEMRKADLQGRRDR